MQLPHVSFLAHQVLGIARSYIEIEQIFGVTNVITNLRRSHLGIENLDCLILVIKNWLTDIVFDVMGLPHL
jgi:hypothetical protein